MAWRIIQSREKFSTHNTYLESSWQAIEKPEAGAMGGISLDCDTKDIIFVFYIQRVVGYDEGG